MLYIDPRIIGERGKNQNRVQPIKGTHKTNQSKNDNAPSKGKKQKEFQKMLQQKAKERDKQPNKKTQPRIDTMTISQEGRNYVKEHDGR